MALVARARVTVEYCGPKGEKTMPTGPLHYRTYEDSAQPLGVGTSECRCMIGADHVADGTVLEEADYAADDALSVWDAAEIWASRGKGDEDTFGYSAVELQKALDDE
ncbi:hypothetical protein [Leifsonia sp. Le1]|uniref:hypothetical protein n=1 Tax=Leifsonia sp. Le1 TaxID=3404918 RepID=UPI003EBCB8A6